MPDKPPVLETDKRIEVVPYDSSWPLLFEREQVEIIRRFGHEIVAVEHIGSTAIPGMIAKPTIDLLVGVKALEVDDHVIEPLEKLGYRYFGEYGIAGRHFFRKGSPPTHHLHWVQHNCFFYQRQVLFRDYIIAHPVEASAYADLKRKLASAYENDRNNYTEAKGEFIWRIVDKAKAWKGVDLHPDE